MIIYHLPPIKGTRKLLWFTTYPLGLFNNDVPRVDRSGVTEKLRRGMSQLSSVAGLLRPARGLKTSFEQWEKTPWFYERGWKSYPLICRVYIRKICFWKGWWISFTKLYIYMYYKLHRMEPGVVHFFIGFPLHLGAQWRSKSLTSWAPNSRNSTDPVSKICFLVNKSLHYMDSHGNDEPVDSPTFTI